MKIFDYKVLTERNFPELTKLVMVALQEGWQPLGGPSGAMDKFHVLQNDLFACWQAVVKYEGEQQ